MNLAGKSESNCQTAKIHKELKITIILFATGQEVCTSSHRAPKNVLFTSSTPLRSKSGEQQKAVNPGDKATEKRNTYQDSNDLDENGKFLIL
jgi:hypothetical protein